MTWWLGSFNKHVSHFWCFTDFRCSVFVHSLYHYIYSTLGIQNINFFISLTFLHFIEGKNKFIFNLLRKRLQHPVFKISNFYVFRKYFTLYPSKGIKIPKNRHQQISKWNPWKCWKEKYFWYKSWKKPIFC